jgi:hypothetical protein
MTSLKKKQKSQTNNLIMHLKLSEKLEQAKSKSSRWNEIIKITTEINEMESKRTIQRINEKRLDSLKVKQE